MTGGAVVMLILFIVVIWGGLVLAALSLRGKVDEEEGDLGTLPGTTDADLIVRGR
ncbi:methionine/alanine import NSS transporter subunit MetS [Corynebacterium nuruki]|uniref:Methionine/alanine import NSS transporter subunit MetS n=1 Tax=Corynebacterium nuruki TaxID=1032851 RepID=A0A3D4T0Y7_9CORY|nr:methionine/alanine import NSS transporter subunit MetS [Corynebacterium nuruki]HCT14937.1 methionine/alanine import NSS transporter subunit MetS [Corynebacterium nuruki]